MLSRSPLIIEEEQLTEARMKLDESNVLPRAFHAEHVEHQLVLRKASDRIAASRLLLCPIASPPWRCA